MKNEEFLVVMRMKEAKEGFASFSFWGVVTFFCNQSFYISKYKRKRNVGFPGFLSCGLLDRNGEWVV